MKRVNHKRGGTLDFSLRKAGLIGVVLLLSIAGSSQSLDSLVTLALSQNRNLLGLEKSQLAARERIGQVGQLPDPELGVGVGVVPVETRLGPQQIRFGATQMIPWPGMLKSQKELARLQASGQWQKTEVYRLTLAYRVQRAWLNWYEVRKSEDILRQHLPLLRSLERIALSKVESGKGLLSQVLTVQLRIRELETQLALMASQKEVPQLEMNQLLGRDSETPMRLVDSLQFADLPYPLDSLEAFVRDNHPQLRWYENQEDLARQALDLNALAAKPSFGVGLDYVITGQRSDADPTNNGRDVVMPRLMVKVPLYREKYRAKSREEALKIAALDYQKADELSRYMTDIRQAYRQYEQAQLHQELYTAQIAQIHSILDLSINQYSADASGFDALLDLYRDLIRYESLQLKAIVDSHRAKVEVERYLKIN